MNYEYTLAIEDRQLEESNNAPVDGDKNSDSEMTEEESKVSLDVKADCKVPKALQENTVRDVSSFLEIQMVVPKEDLPESGDLVKDPVDDQCVEDPDELWSENRTCMWMVPEGKDQRTKCGKEFQTIEGLVSHCNAEHLYSPGLYVCSWEGCKRNEVPFKQRSGLIGHFRSHSGERPFPCTHKGCGMSFTVLSALRLHMNLHSNATYPCTYPGCRKVFSHEKTMLVHNRVRHKGEGAFKCPFDGCGMVFSGAFNLRKHYVRHERAKPHVCKFPKCPLSFATKESRDEHFAQHRNDGAHECPFEGCGKRFPEAYRLRQHERMHTGEKRYLCSHFGCEKTFSTVSNMKSHVERRHSKSTQ